jgi:hypothetical protein
MRIREPQPDDQMNLIKELADANIHFDTNIWVAACFSCIASTFQTNGFTYEQYKEEMEKAAEIYETWWDKE